MATVIDIKDREDGGADVTLELSDYEVTILLEDAITRALTNYLLFESSAKLNEEKEKIYQNTKKDLKPLNAEKTNE